VCSNKIQDGIILHLDFIKIAAISSPLTKLHYNIGGMIKTLPQPEHGK